MGPYGWFNRGQTYEIRSAHCSNIISKDVKTNNKCLRSLIKIVSNCVGESLIKHTVDWRECMSNEHSNIIPCILIEHQLHENSEKFFSILTMLAFVCFYKSKGFCIFFPLTIIHSYPCGPLTFFSVKTSKTYSFSQKF